MNAKIFSLLFLMFFYGFAKGQNISNPQVEQQSDSKILLQYDLNSPQNDTKVKLLVSNQGFKTTNAQNVSGDIGKHIRNGQKQVVYDWQRQFPRLQSAEFVLVSRPTYALNRRSTDLEFMSGGGTIIDEEMYVVVNPFDIGWNFKRSNVWGWGARFGVIGYYGITLGPYISGKWGSSNTNFNVKAGPSMVSGNLGYDVAIGMRQRIFEGLGFALRLGVFGPKENNNLLPILYLSSGFSYSWAKKQRTTVRFQNKTTPVGPRPKPTEVVENNKPPVIKPKPTDDPDPNSPVKNLIWIQPNPDEMPTNFNVSKSAFALKLKVISQYKTINSDYKIYLNDVLFKGERMEQGGLMGETFSAIVQLKPGKNKIQVSCRGKDSAPIFVNYNTDKPVLHLISIGVKQPDLLFTQKDAADLAAIYELYKNPELFQRVQRKVLIGEKATAGEIRGIFEEYKVLFQQGEIGSNDVLMVFLSSHGFIDNDKFYIQGSDYAPLRRTTTSVSYEEIMKQISEIKCKKIMFVDACHSGGAKISQTDIFEAMKKLSQHQTGLYAVASSTGSQVSYEDPAWQNGAMTEALLEGLNGAADGFGSTGTKDEIIYLYELFDYIKSRVPKLVKDVKNDLQTPTLIRDDLGNIPIFIKK